MRQVRNSEARALRLGRNIPATRARLSLGCSPAHRLVPRASYSADVREDVGKRPSEPSGCWMVSASAVPRGIGFTAEIVRPWAACRNIHSAQQEPVMRAVVLAALLALSTCGRPVFAGPCLRADRPFQPNFERLAASGIEHETLDGEDMARALASLHRVMDFDETPNRIIVIYGNDRAVVWLIEGETLCRVLYGPADGLRAIVKDARGLGV